VALRSGERVVINPSLTDVGAIHDLPVSMIATAGSASWPTVDGVMRSTAPRRPRIVQSFPAAFSLDEAACIPTAYLNGLAPLIESENCQPGETVLIHGPGGVSSAAIQLARKRGATVLATPLDRKLAYRAAWVHITCSITKRQHREWRRQLTGGPGDMVSIMWAGLWAPSLARSGPGGRLVNCVPLTTGPRVTLNSGSAPAGAADPGFRRLCTEEFERVLSLYCTVHTSSIRNSPCGKPVGAAAMETGARRKTCLGLKARGRVDLALNRPLVQ